MLDALKNESRIGGYRIVRVLGSDASGVLYLARAEADGRLTALREYFPRNRAHRGAGGAVEPAGDAAAFRSGLRHVASGVRRLIGSTHPAVAAPFEAFEENGTTYAAAPFIDGATLETWRAGAAAPIGAGDLRRLFHPILEALGDLHDRNLFHRRLSPTSIMVSARNGRVDARSAPHLVDFGAYRDRPTLEAEADGPFVAPEVAAGGGRMTTAAEVYAAAATLYALAEGASPPSPAARSARIRDGGADPAALSAETAHRVSEPVARAIGAGLRLEPSERPQTVGAFLDLLGWRRSPRPQSRGGRASPSLATSAAADADAGRSDIRVRPGPGPVMRAVYGLAAMITIVAFLGGGFLVGRLDAALERPAQSTRVIELSLASLTPAAARRDVAATEADALDDDRRARAFEEWAAALSDALDAAGAAARAQQALAALVAGDDAPADAAAVAAAAVSDAVAELEVARRSYDVAAVEALFARAAEIAIRLDREDAAARRDLVAGWRRAFASARQAAASRVASLTSTGLASLDSTMRAALLRDVAGLADRVAGFARVVEARGRRFAVDVAEAQREIVLAAEAALAARIALADDVRRIEDRFAPIDPTRGAAAIDDAAAARRAAISSELHALRAALAVEDAGFDLAHAQAAATALDRAVAAALAQAGHEVRARLIGPLAEVDAHVRARAEAGEATLSLANLRFDLAALLEAISGLDDAALIQRYAEFEPQVDALWRRIPHGPPSDIAILAFDAVRIEEPDPPTEPVARAPGERFRDCAVCPEMVVLPVDPERAPASLALGVHEVTVEEFARFVSATGRRIRGGCATPIASGGLAADPTASWRAPGFAQLGHHPATCVSHADAVAYVAWLNEQVDDAPFRLPSAGELVHAMRGGADGPYPWSGGAAAMCGLIINIDADLAGAGGDWPCRDPNAHTTSVAIGAPNAFGLFHIQGNVAEWATDCWTPGASDALCEDGVVMGGSWASGLDALRLDARGRLGRDVRASVVGFRIARDL